jgi:DNA-binding XRE family transcriptional regulator
MGELSIYGALAHSWAETSPASLSGDGQSAEHASVDPRARMNYNKAKVSFWRWWTMNVPLPSLRRQRQEAALTQVELAQRASVTEVTIVRLEAGKPARMSTIRKLARALKVKPVELMAKRED